MPVVMWEALPAISTRPGDRLYPRAGSAGRDGPGLGSRQADRRGRQQALAAGAFNLDEALSKGMTLVASLAPGAAMRSHEAYLRVNREGKPVSTENVCGLFPELIALCENVGASVARSFGDHPAFGAALIHTEVRDHASLCFHPHDLAAYRTASGAEIPAEATSTRGVDYTKLPDFPADRVIADDDPILRYYRWYWKDGDGWNGLNSAVARGLKKAGRADLWTWHDPAVRVASVYGSGGQVDYLSQWTYSYPDPIRIGLATDELLAMAGGGPKGQQVMKMTQIIWYRYQTGPEAKRRPGSRRIWPIGSASSRTPPSSRSPMASGRRFGRRSHGRSRGSCTTAGRRLSPASRLAATVSLTRRRSTSWRGSSAGGRAARADAVERAGAKSDVAFLESFASEMFASAELMAGAGAGPATRTTRCCDAAPAGDRFR